MIKFFFNYVYLVLYFTPRVIHMIVGWGIWNVWSLDGEFEMYESDKKYQTYKPKCL